ncbi:hypothetical protein B0T16DRAFT_341506, partial [Cercophora newfieldiana]
MIRRAIELRPAVEIYQFRLRSTTTYNHADLLRTDDWRELTYVRDVLERFKILTKVFGGPRSVFGEVLPAAIDLLTHLHHQLYKYGYGESIHEFTGPDSIPPALDFFDRIEERREFASFSAIQKSISFAIKNLVRHIKLLEQSPAYWAAAVLHPRIRARWIELNLEP